VNNYENVGGVMKVTDMNAMKKWNQIPKHEKELLLNNVFCSKCGNTTIQDYDMYNDKFGILLKGKCKKCSGEVARLIEID
jgi:ribosomal protein S27AE